jgi:hypothetical protein
VLAQSLWRVNSRGTHQWNKGSHSTELSPLGGESKRDRDITGGTTRKVSSTGGEISALIDIDSRQEQCCNRSPIWSRDKSRMRDKSILIAFEEIRFAVNKWFKSELENRLRLGQKSKKTPKLLDWYAKLRHNLLTRALRQTVLISTQAWNPFKKDENRWRRCETTHQLAVHSGVPTDTLVVVWGVVILVKRLCGIGSWVSQLHLIVISESFHLCFGFNAAVPQVQNSPSKHCDASNTVTHAHKRRRCACHCSSLIFKGKKVRFCVLPRD